MRAVTQESINQSIRNLLRGGVLLFLFTVRRTVDSRQ